MIGSGSGSSMPAGYPFPRGVIAVGVRWYLRCGLSYRDVEELLADRGVEVDHVTVGRWVRTFTPEFIDAARASRHSTGDRWFAPIHTSGRRSLGQGHGSRPRVDLCCRSSAIFPSAAAGRTVRAGRACDGGFGHAPVPGHAIGSRSADGRGPGVRRRDRIGSAVSVPSYRRWARRTTHPGRCRLHRPMST